jgi:MraZ protein
MVVAILPMPERGASVAAGGAVFNDVHLNGVDPKGRVSLPAAFRQTIDIRCGGGKVASGLERVLRMSKHPKWPCIEVSDARQVADHEEQMEAHAQREAEKGGRMHGDILEEEEAKAYPLMKDVNFDAAGRMILPERLRLKAEIGEEAFFVGRGRKFRIWNPDILRKTSGGESVEVIEEMEDLLSRRKERG